MPEKEITLQFNKNDQYVRPPVVYGDGHMIKCELSAPGLIRDVQYSCDGLGCGWTHIDHYVDDTPYHETAVGWSNSGQNCIMYFKLRYEEKRLKDLL